MILVLAEKKTKEKDATIDDSFSFIDVPVKDDTVNHHRRVMYCAKANNATVLAQLNKIMLLHTMLSWPLIAKNIQFF